MEPATIIALGSLVIAFCGLQWAVAKYILKEVADQARFRKEGDDALHQRINDVRDAYLKKEDFHRWTDGLDKQLDKMERMLAAHNDGMNKRIDDVLAALTVRSRTE